ncbi:MAG: hypothetical protein DRP29_01945 [Thermodesulfobacteriota bacterium]|nr:MAG: hypothetical protein DRP29_01945 [Thermodesulfobacteriota bacterium]RLF92990.1 MAG: hypothetical protein DRN52_07140 [Thermococci archaeon]
MVQQVSVVSNKRCDVYRGTASDSASPSYKFSKETKNIDIFCTNADLLIQIKFRKGIKSDWIWIPANFFVSFNCNATSFKVKNYTAGQNATWQVIAWYE